MVRALLNRLAHMVPALPPPPLPVPDLKAEATSTGRLTITLNLRWVELLAQEGDATAARLLNALAHEPAAGDWGGGDSLRVDCNQRNAIDLAEIISRASRQQR